MVWTVKALEPVAAWLSGLEPDAYLRVLSVIRNLEQHGPQLGTPYVKKIESSKHANMKELRIPYGDQQFRILFAFDSKRRGLLLAAADKIEFGVDDFYTHYVPIADRLFSEELKRLEEEDKAQKANNSQRNKSRKRGGKR